MVQAYQLHVNHPNLHYTLVLFCYEKEIVIKFKEYSNLFFLDDKYYCKVGESNYPVAAIE